IPVPIVVHARVDLHRPESLRHVVRVGLAEVPVDVISLDSHVVGRPSWRLGKLTTSGGEEQVAQSDTSNMWVRVVVESPPGAIFLHASEQLGLGCNTISGTPDLPGLTHP